MTYLARNTVKSLNYRTSTYRLEADHLAIEHLDKEHSVAVQGAQAKSDSF
jgi:hypothetical protein